MMRTPIICTILVLCIVFCSAQGRQNQGQPNGAPSSGGGKNKIGGGSKDGGTLAKHTGITLTTPKDEKAKKEMDTMAPSSENFGHVTPPRPKQKPAESRGPPSPTLSPQEKFRLKFPGFKTAKARLRYPRPVKSTSKRKKSERKQMTSKRKRLRKQKRPVAVPSRNDRTRPVLTPHRKRKISKNTETMSGEIRNSKETAGTRSHGRSKVKAEKEVKVAISLIGNGNRKSPGIGYVTQNEARRDEDKKDDDSDDDNDGDKERGVAAVVEEQGVGYGNTIKNGNRVGRRQPLRIYTLNNDRTAPRLAPIEIFSPFCRDKVDGDYDNPGFRPRDGADRCTYIECSNRRTFLLECAGQEGAWPDSRYGYRYGHHRQPWFVTPHRYYHYMYRRHGRDFCRINERAFRMCQRIFGYDF